MKKILIFSILILSIQSVLAQPKVVEEKRFKNGDVVKMCVFDDGHYGYCSEEDEYCAIKHYNSDVKNTTKVEKINNNIGNGVNMINGVLNGVRVITSYFGL